MSYANLMGKMAKAACSLLQYEWLAICSACRVQHEKALNLIRAIKHVFNKEIWAWRLHLYF
jgi:hypothetical protein